VALSFIKPDEIDYSRARNAAEGAKLQSVRHLARNRNLLYFVLCLMLFQFADAPVLPLLSQDIGMNKAEISSLQISGLIATAQLVVVFLAP